MAVVDQAYVLDLTGQPKVNHLGSTYGCILQVENSLMPIDENNNPLWGAQPRSRNT